ncbi:MAG: alpha/beta fold hydrolase [Thermomicrobiales bacterium]
MRIAVNDTELYFDVEGAGLVPDGHTMRERPTILLLHGGPGFDHTGFKPFLSLLADTAQLIYLDQRGQGQSARAPIETCTPEQMADDAVALCRALGIARPVVLGHSYGGFVALHMAIRHPDAVGSLILVDTAAATADMGDAGATLQARYGAEARAAAERVFAGDFSEAAMAAFSHLVAPAYVGNPANLEAVSGIWARSSFNPEVASYYFRELAPTYDPRSRLGEIRAPTLVVAGEQDWLTPPSASRVIAAGTPGADLIVIPDVGHFPFAEQPEAFAAIVRRFLEGVRAEALGVRENEDAAPNA